MGFKDIELSLMKDLFLIIPLFRALYSCTKEGGNVTITPYLSRDTTYCYRHCKGISRFPLLLHHPSPRSMPDRTTSTSLTFAYVIMPYRTQTRTPITCTASRTASFL